MRHQSLPIRHIAVLALAVVFAGGLSAVTAAQSQEPKPVLPATPVAGSDLAGGELPSTAVSGSSWQGPNWGVSVSWDPAIWTVEGEAIELDYDGLQIGTPISTVYIEAYRRFDGDADECLADAAAELASREGISEAMPLTDRAMPVPEDIRGVAELFGLTATLADGTVYRGIEYIECRTVAPGEALLEITWQTVTGGFNEDFANVESLLAAIEIPDAGDAAATPTVPLATPVA